MKSCTLAALAALPCLCFACARAAGEDGEVTIGPRAVTPEDQERTREEVMRLAAGLRDPDAGKFRAAAEALGETRSPQALSYLQQAYALSDAARRRAVLVALGRFKARGLEAFFFQASLNEPYLALRRAAAEGLVKSAGRDGAAKAYLEALRDPKKLTPLGRLRATQLLAHAGGQGAAEGLRELLRDADTDVVSAACEGLAVLGDASSVRELVEVLAKRDVETAPAACEALERLTGQKYRQDLVKWKRWLAEQEAGKAPEPAKAKEDYAPDYGDPYQRPVTESPVDFVLVYDTTGSLGKIWPEVSIHLDAVLAEMAKKTPSLRLGAVRYRADNLAKTSRYLIEPKPLTRNVQSVRDNVLDASFGGGSGGLYLGLQHAISAFNWRAYARKAVLVIGDITPEGDGLARAAQTIKEGWEQDRIHFNCLYIRSAHGEEQRPTYTQLAAVGAGRFYEYDKAWRHLVDWSAEKPDPKTGELPMMTLEKWLKPLVRPSKP